MTTDNYIINSNFNISNIDAKNYNSYESILVQIFCSQEKNQLKQIAKEIKKILPQSVCIGSTSAGEIDNNKTTDNSTLVAISCFEHTTIKTAKSSDNSSIQRGLDIGTKLNHEDNKLMILFANSLNTNIEELLNGIKKINSKFTICGAVPGNINNQDKTYVLLDEEVYSNSVVAVSLHSKELKVKTDFKFNCSAIGIEHTITKSRNNVIYEIDNIPIKEFYKKYLGDDIIKYLPHDANTFPILVKKNNNYLARALINILEDGGFEYTVPIKNNEKIKLGFTNEEFISKNPLLKSFDKFQKAQSFFIYACKTRKCYIKEWLKNENFNHNINTCGFFTNGEFLKIKNRFELLNQTFTVVALSEEKKSIEHNQEDSSSDTSNSQRKLKKLMHLVKQSSMDYDEQSKKLEVEKINSQMLLTSQKIFLRHAVHETNTPLSVIMSNIELFEMQYGKNPYLITIEVALKNIFNIYDDLSYLVKKDQVTYPKKNLDIIDFIRSRIEFFSQSAKQIGSEIKFFSDKSFLFLNINETKLQRIIDNNLTNAIKYTEENSNIYITLKQEFENHALTISSCSQYIRYPKKIFKEYYREESTKKGFGLGLSLVKRVCDEENIKIKIESNEYFTSFRYLFKVS
ncbi:MAG: FIST N-terminal domain-containing protein [Campylobacterota bacterium]